MFNTLPKDPMLCLSVVNTKLRDHYENLDLLCEDLGVSKEVLNARLGDIDFIYDEEKNQFRRDVS